MHKLKKHIMTTAAGIFFVCALIITPSITFAQVQVPNIGDAVKEATPPPPERPAQKEAPATPVIIQEEEKPFSLPEGEKIFIKDFRLEGAKQGDETELSALLDPYKNRELTMAEITEAANKVTLFYRNKGYLVAKAYVPKQDARDGILVIKIIMGNYGKFSLKNTSLVRDFLLQGVFDSAKDASPVVTRNGLERAILLVRDMPGSKMPTVTIAPGATPGTSDFDVNVDASQRLNGYIMVDNQGSRYTGRYRLYGGVDINSPLGIADKFSISGMTTANWDLQNVRLSYGFPLFPFAYNGLRAEFAASRTTYELGGIYSDLDATGRADVVEGTISYPVKRSRDESIDLSLNVAYKNLHDDLDAVDLKNPRDATVATLTLQRGVYGSLFGRNLFTTMSGSVNLGDLNIKDESQKALNKAGADTGHLYSKLNVAVSGNLELTEKLSARASVRLQKVLTAHNLDSTEQLFISGTTGVKAYLDSVSFDNGYVANAELRYALPTLFGIKHAVGLFVDNGWVRAQHGNYTSNDHFMLSDVGLGYYIGFKQFFGGIQIAQPIGRTSGVTDPETRVLAQIGVAF